MEATHKDEEKLLRPYAIEFTDGYYSVRQCRDLSHAKQRAREDHGHRIVKAIRLVT